MGRGGGKVTRSHPPPHLLYRICVRLTPAVVRTGQQSNEAFRTRGRGCWSGVLLSPARAGTPGPQGSHTRVARPRKPRRALCPQLEAREYARLECGRARTAHRGLRRAGSVRVPRPRTTTAWAACKPCCSHLRILAAASVVGGRLAVPPMPAGTPLIVRHPRPGPSQGIMFAPRPGGRGKEGKTIACTVTQRTVADQASHL